MRTRARIGLLSLVLQTERKCYIESGNAKKSYLWLIRISKIGVFDINAGQQPNPMENLSSLKLNQKLGLKGQNIVVKRKFKYENSPNEISSIVFPFIMQTYKNFGCSGLLNKLNFLYIY